MSLFIRFFLVAIVVIFAGCSRIRVAYDWAATMILWRMDDYFDIASAQKSKARTIVQRELRGLLEHESPKWIKYFRTLGQSVLDPNLSRAQYTAQRDQLFDFYWTASGRLIEAAQELALDLKPSQFAYFKAVSEKNIAKELSKAPDKILARTKERYERVFEFLRLDLNTEQKKQLDEFVTKSASSPEEFLNQRRVYVEKFVKAGEKPGDVKKYLQDFLSRGPNDLRPQDRIERLKKYQDAAIRFEHSLVQSLTPAQRRRISDRLNDIAEQVDRLREREGFALAKHD